MAPLVALRCLEKQHREIFQGVVDASDVRGQVSQVWTTECNLRAPHSAEDCPSIVFPPRSREPRTCFNGRDQRDNSRVERALALNWVLGPTNVALQHGGPRN